MDWKKTADDLAGALDAAITWVEDPVTELQMKKILRRYMAAVRDAGVHKTVDKTVDKTA